MEVSFQKQAFLNFSDSFLQPVFSYLCGTKELAMAIRFSLAVIGLLGILHSISNAQVIVLNPYNTNYADPRLAYLHGVADLNRKVAETSEVFAKAQQEWEKAKQENLNTRRKTIEHLQWAFEYTERNKVENLRSKNDVEGGKSAFKSDPDIISDRKLLPKLLSFLIENRELLDQNDSAAIPQDCLKFIATNTGKNEIGGSLALLKDQSILWPMLFQDKVFEKEKKQVNDSILILKQQSLSLERMNLGLFRTMQDTLLTMEQKRYQLIGRDDYDPKASDDARHFILDLRKCLTDLQSHPEALKVLFAQPQGRNVYEFVHFMADNGLSIADPSENLTPFYKKLWLPLSEEGRKIWQKKHPKSPGNP